MSLGSKLIDPTSFSTSININVAVTIPLKRGNMDTKIQNDKVDTINDKEKENFQPVLRNKPNEEEKQDVASPNGGNVAINAHEHYKTEILEQDGKKRTLFKCTMHWPYMVNGSYICTFSTRHRSSILPHITGLHFGIKPFKCNECPYVSTFKHSLESHQIREHGGIKDQNSDIEIASMSFLNDEGEKVYKCTKCDYSAKKIGHVKTHLPWHNKGLVKSRPRRKRPGNKDAPMDIPEKKISEDESLIVLMHTQKTLNCSHCNFAASTIDDMGNHMQSKHDMQ